MFERYTEKARRVIFFARYEASSFGSSYIETEHLLLGLLREDKALTNRFLRQYSSGEEIRKQIEANTTIRDKVSTSVDLPLSNESKRVLAFATEEAEQLGHRHIGTEHLLLGLLREEKSFAAQLLHERGVRLSEVRRQLANPTQPKEQVFPQTTQPGPGNIEFLDAGGAQIATALLSRMAPSPRTGEIVVLEIGGERRRYRVTNVEFQYRSAFVSAPQDVNVLQTVLVHVVP
jgi:ATP-dependent Clp protease ATP-binding subunit ClpA